MPEVSLYQLLGTRPQASPAELRRDYERALATANRSGATKHMVRLVEAYEVLSDPHRRAKYDATGRAVPPQHVGNPYGRQVPFRSDRPGLGQHRRRAVAAPTVVPSSVRSQGSTARGVGLTLLSLAAAAAVTTGVMWMRTASAPRGELVPGPAGSQTLVMCAGTQYWAAAGASVTCPGGVAPAWGPTRPR